MNQTMLINEQAVASVIFALHAEGAPPDRAALLLRRAVHELGQRGAVPSAPPTSSGPLGSRSTEPLVPVLAGGLDLDEAIERGRHDASLTKSSNRRQVPRGGDKEPKSWRE
jgi:hypothetical protein